MIYQRLNILNVIHIKTCSILCQSNQRFLLPLVVCGWFLRMIQFFASSCFQHEKLNPESGGGGGGVGTDWGSHTFSLLLQSVSTVEGGRRLTYLVVLWWQFLTLHRRQTFQNVSIPSPPPQSHIQKDATHLGRHYFSGLRLAMSGIALRTAATVKMPCILLTSTFPDHEVAGKGVWEREKWSCFEMLLLKEPSSQPPQSYTAGQGKVASEVQHGKSICQLLLFVLLPSLIASWTFESLFCSPAGTVRENLKQVFLVYWEVQRIGNICFCPSL